MSAGEAPLPPKRRRGRPLRVLGIAVVAGAIGGMVLAFMLVGPIGSLEGGPGSRARDYASDRYPKLTVEVDWVVEGGSDYRPAASVLSWLDQRLEAHLSKPGGIQVQYGNAVAASESSYTLAALRSAEAANRAAHTTRDTASIWIFVANRYSQSNTSGNVAGVAYSASAVAVFGATIEGGSQFPSLDDEVMQITLLHEIGHLLGLVNLGTPMVTAHEDAAHPGHSNNERSVMYWAVEGPGLGQLLALGTAPDDFDADDIADLRAIGGK